ncbi:transposase [Moorena producens PAL-8-15-08-1]|uniref:Transposase n=1 Tax=Moorena producens PAL-8-15-08-1 TaxID=1458985 RepID=A0A1D8U4A4_9CYAN|nr:MULTISPECIES: RNA-guided endonuclease TnpB family protein [Moorena]AOX04594.1 transposase [Moorena producens PAL-8-15-08-1]NEO77583.1 IS200/IS605 family element transposase accessory protein TnpB [Moorena sp. SIO4G3]
MYKALQTKLKLNNHQKTLMAKHAGYSRWVYNWGLALWQQAYSEGLKPSASKLRKLFTNHVKPQYPWMNQLSSKVYQYAFIDLGEAIARFFKGNGGYPRFKKKGAHDSFTIDNSGAPIKLSGCKHKLPLLGWVRTYEPLPEVTTKKITISRQADGWYLSFHYGHEPNPTPKQIDVVGVDLGVKALAVLSTGEIICGSKPYRQAKKQLARCQRDLSRKVKGSQNWYKAVNRLAKKHQRVANIRKDTLHKLTAYLAKNHGTVAIEDLNVSGMMANHRLAGSVADQGFYEFKRQLEYKCEWYGSKLVIVDRFYPSSQLCSSCGHRQKMTLKIRTYNCPKCGLSLDRDLNAAINLKNAVGSMVSACGRSAADSSGRSRK